MSTVSVKNLAIVVRVIDTKMSELETALDDLDYGLKKNEASSILKSKLEGLKSQKLRLERIIVQVDDDEDSKLINQLIQENGEK